MLCSESRLTAGLTACKPCRIRSLNALAGKQYSGTTPHRGHLAGRHLVLAPRAALCKHLHTGSTVPAPRRTFRHTMDTRLLHISSAEAWCQPQHGRACFKHCPTLCAPSSDELCMTFYQSQATTVALPTCCIKTQGQSMTNAFDCNPAQERTMVPSSLFVLRHTAT